MKVEILKIKKLAKTIFEKAGLSPDDADIITEVLTETEARGVFTHGFIRLPRYVDCLLSGGIKKDGTYETLVDTPSWSVLDGNNNLGIVISYKATSLAIRKAAETGIGVVNVRHSHHFGAAGYYTSMCADKSMAGFAMSNGDVLLAATGAKNRSIGNNPFSFAFPANKYGKIVYDIAMSHTSDQKVIKMAKDNLPLPEGWIIDKNGKPTTDASEYEKGGTLLPFGGYKGYGMAMMVETLAGILSGSATTKNVHAWNTDPNVGGNVGHFFMALDLSKTGDVNAFRDKTDALIEEMKNSPKAEGVSEIYFPGEIEAAKSALCRQRGWMDIADSTVEAVISSGEKLGLKAGL